SCEVFAVDRLFAGTLRDVAVHAALHVVHQQDAPKAVQFVKERDLLFHGLPSRFARGRDHLPDATWSGDEVVAVQEAEVDPRLALGGNKAEVRAGNHERPTASL